MTHQDCFIAIGPGRDDVDRRANRLRQAFEIPLGVRRQPVPGLNPTGALGPARHFFENRLHVLDRIGAIVAAFNAKPVVDPRLPEAMLYDEDGMPR